MYPFFIMSFFIVTIKKEINFWQLRDKYMILHFMTISNFLFVLFSSLFVPFHRILPHCFHLLLELGVCPLIILHSGCSLCTQHNSHERHWLCKYFIIGRDSSKGKRDFLFLSYILCWWKSYWFQLTESTESVKPIIFISHVHSSFKLYSLGSTVSFFSLSNSIFCVAERMNEHYLNTKN